MTSPLLRITAWFEALTPQTLATIGDIYAKDAHFKDPFNDVVGIEKIQAIYAHMFENLTNPRFEITQVIEQQSQKSQQSQKVQQSQQSLQQPSEPAAHETHAFVAWQFKFEWRGERFDVPGGTRFLVNGQGLVTDHVDYWDPAAGIYERLPLIGVVLRKLRQRMAT